MVFMSFAFATRHRADTRAGRSGSSRAYRRVAASRLHVSFTDSDVLHLFDIEIVFLIRSP
jgi:hypothetical protein